MKEVADAINKSSLDDNIKNKLVNKFPLTLRIYGLPKIHKEGASLRPIVNMIGGPIYKLAKYLSNTSSLM